MVIFKNIENFCGFCGMNLSSHNRLDLYDCAWASEICDKTPCPRRYNKDLKKLSTVENSL